MTEGDRNSSSLQADVERQTRLLSEHRLLLDSIPAMLWVKDCANRILRCNRAAAASQGRTVGELEGHWTEEFYPEEAAKYLADDLEVIASGKPKRSIVERLEIAPGEKRWVKTDKIPHRDETGAIVGVIVFSVDVTDLKQTEEALRVSEERYRLLVDPFFTTKPLGVGTGLGLTICRNIVHALGGSIDAESSPRRGATFRVVLPASESAAVRTASPPPVLRSPPTVRLLIVDDERAFARSLQTLLSDHDIVLAHTGREAVELCSLQDFDCILCDVMMPDLTGMDVYERLEAARPGFGSRIVFMTGGTFTQRARDFRARVSNTFLEKPFDIREVERILASLLLR